MKKLLAALTILLAATVAAAGIPFGTTTRAEATYYNSKGYGACGTQIDAKRGLFVAVSHEWWTSANPNKDPLCRASVKLTYKGQSIKVPVKDKCPGCSKNNIDLSKPLFLKLGGDSSIDRLEGVTYTFVKP